MIPKVLIIEHLLRMHSGTELVVVVTLEYLLKWDIGLTRNAIKGCCNNNVTSKSNKTPDSSSKNIKQPEKFREEGRNEYEKGNYQEALKAMDIAIKMLNDQAYEFGEMTETQTSNFNKLIIGYYFDRGEIKLKLGDSYGSISDFSKVLDLATNENEWVSVNFSSQKLYLLKRNLGDYKYY